MSVADSSSTSELTRVSIKSWLVSEFASGVALSATTNGFSRESCTTICIEEPYCLGIRNVTARVTVTTEAKIPSNRALCRKTDSTP